MPALGSVRAKAVLAIAMAAAGCRTHVSKEPLVAGGDVERGRLAIESYGCGSCHTIPGVHGARGLVGPPLADVGRRVFIAGVLPNDPRNMVRWIMNPPAVDSKTAMPDLGVPERDARDMAEYLYVLSVGRR
jgi:cytochrome c